MARPNKWDPPSNPLDKNQLTRQHLLRLIEVQATLLRRALLTGDMLRWKLINSGYPLDQIDHMPDIDDPATGKCPPSPKVATGIRIDPADPPQLLRVVAAAEMDDEAFRKHCWFRHRDQADMTTGIHDWIHLTRKGNHTHAESAASRTGTRNGRAGQSASVQRHGSGDKKSASKSTS
jgi:hypothetical protein